MEEIKEMDVQQKILNEEVLNQEILTQEETPLNETQNEIQKKPQDIEVPQWCAIITDNLDMAKTYIPKLKKHGHIFLINNKNCVFYHPRVSVVQHEGVQLQSGVIYKDMFEKRLVHIIVDNDNEECVNVKNKIIEVINLDKEFCFGHGGLFSISNFWNNLSSIVDNPNTSSLRDLFKGKPIVLVNSGPSLNKDIEVLKENQNKFVIIASSTAIGALYKNGIKPHFLAMIDPYPMVKDFVLPYCTKDTILLASSVTCNDFIKEYPGPVIYYYTNGGIQITGQLYKDLNVTEGIYTSATVTTAAFSLALFMGGSPIVFLGQDMCFEDTKTYADGVSGIVDNIPIEMTTIDGRIVKTLTAYKEVFDYFNSTVPNIKDRDIINCSNGAGILGAKVMSLKDVVDQYCNEDIAIPEIKQSKVINKAQLLSKICLIKNDIEELIRYKNLFRQYIENLLESGIDINYIYTEINEFFTNLKDKKSYFCGSMFFDWVWYLLIINEDKSTKLDSLKLLDDVLNKILGLIDNQIKVMSAISENNLTEIKQEV
jgi:hypothetical protein